MLWTVGAIVGVFVALWVVRRLGQVDRAEARRLVEAGARLIDVRTPEEFESGHLSAAKNLPLRELAARLGELEPKSAPVVLYCESGTRSAVARRILKRGGFTAVYDLGAMRRW